MTGIKNLSPKNIHHPGPTFDTFSNFPNVNYKYNVCQNEASYYFSAAVALSRGKLSISSFIQYVPHENIAIVKYYLISFLKCVVR